MERVVLDTNILVGGAYDAHSASWRIVQMVLDGQLRAFTSRKLTDEYRTILKRAVKDPEYHERIHAFLRAAQSVWLDCIPTVIADDPEDDKVLATAVVANAEAIISSDRHLLDLDPYQGIRIVQAQPFLNLLSERDNHAWSSFASGIGLSPRDQ